MSLLRTCPVRIAGSITIAAGLLIAAPTAMAQGAFGETNAPSTEAIASDSVSFNIRAQDLSSALIEFGRQSGQELLYSRRDTDGLQANGVTGRYSRAAAMSVLLDGTGLEFELTANGGMLIADRAALDARLAEMEALRTRGTDALPSVQAASVAGNAGAAGSSADSGSRFVGIEEVIVTGQKREERLQDVPIAISAFSMDTLDKQKIEGGFDLLRAVPNVTFSKSNFTGYNFQIRGIGTQAISATTDPGVAVSFNNTTLIVNRLFEQEYLDIERVEVLRGPQGTLFGRNATAGVVNVITSKPRLGVYEGAARIEVGNYNAQRFRGHLNFPIIDEDKYAARLAFASTRRDGYTRNLAAYDIGLSEFSNAYDRAGIDSKIDDRNIWTGRLSIAAQPTDRLRVDFIYERFEESDRRLRSAKQLCHHDDGEVTLYDRDGNAYSLMDSIPDSQKAHPNFPISYRTTYTAQLTQGCKPGSMYDEGDRSRGNHGAFGTPNGNAIPFVRAGRGTSFQIGAMNFPGTTCVSNRLISDCVEDPLFVDGGQSRNLRDIYSLINPEYVADSDIYDFSIKYELTDALSLQVQSNYTKNYLYSTQDFLRYLTLPMFGDSSQAINTPYPYRSDVTPGGVLHDPQLGPSNRLLMQDVSRLNSTQFSQEVRVSSANTGMFNFSVGANYTRFENTADYFVFINALRALVYGGNIYAGQPTMWNGEPALLAASAAGGTMTIGCGRYIADFETDFNGNQRATCIHMQGGSIKDVINNPEGHNFFMSRNPFKLSSASLFGEVYLQVTDAVKLTAGLRFNWDRKTFTPVPSQTLLADWRGRMEGGTVFDSPSLFDESTQMALMCDPRLNGGNFGFTLGQVPCALGGSAEHGRGYPSMPDIVQEWRVPTGRLGIDYKIIPSNDSLINEALLYAFYTRGYKAGGANPPTQSAPSGLLLAAAQGAAAPPTFKAEYVDALEIGLKGTALNGSMNFGLSSFVYKYDDYQISKIVDRSAVNENIDALVWGVEFEGMLALGENTLLSTSMGFLRTRVASGEYSLDLMDRTQGGNINYADPAWADLDCSSASNHNNVGCVDSGEVDSSGNPIYKNNTGFDRWVVVRPTLTQASSCIAPAALIYEEIQDIGVLMSNDQLAHYCPGGRLITGPELPEGYSPFTSAPNSAAGFMADISGNELPNAPRFTFSLGLQHTVWLPVSDWSLSGRVDMYWQSKSYSRVYNTEYDRLRSWSNANISAWFESPQRGLVLEFYVKNVFDTAPITGAFLNSDDTGLSTNIFTLDPRLIGVSITKNF